MSKHLDLLEGRRTSLVSERDGILESSTPETFTPEVEARTQALDIDITALEVRIAEQGERDAAEQRGAKIDPRVTVGHEPNPVYRKNDVTASYFRDVVASMLGRADLGTSSNEARDRLIASQVRAMTGAAGSGGEFAPPLWLIDEFVPLARAARVTADLVNKKELPSGVSSVNLPKVNTGTTVAAQTPVNTAASLTDLTTTSVSSGIVTIAGQAVLPLQLLAQSGINIDDVVLADLAADYAMKLDRQVLNGTGTGGTLRGLVSGAGVGATTYTTATPKVVDGTTAANSFYNKLISASMSILTSRYQPATACVMHPNRWGWMLEALDSSQRPLIVPSGPSFNGVGVAGDIIAQGQAGEILGNLPIYLDPNIIVNDGAGINQDQVFIMRASDVYLWETPLVSASFDATYANVLDVLLRVHAFAAMIPDRFGPSVNVIKGTGLIVPVL